MKSVLRLHHDKTDETVCVYDFYQSWVGHEGLNPKSNWKIKELFNGFKQIEM